MPSASTLAVMRREFADRKPTSQTVAVLADPVLEDNDPRLKLALAKAKSSSGPANNAALLSPVGLQNARRGGDTLRSLREAGFSLERLQYTRKEAEAIAAFAQTDKSLKALDFEANKGKATSADLSNYRIIHFATHGLLDSQHPELSAVVFSLIDERGNPQDGFLRLHDVYNLKLNADLVVLSACQTALGKEIRGEGLVGLTRGFMYAGANRIVASLWDVRDEATAELMKQFYEAMLKQGMRPAAALRAAQVSMWRKPRFASPYYWAAFVLQGEWR